MSEKIFVTGCAGFIGYHVCKCLLDMKYIVIGIDNMNDYYDVSIKENNIADLKQYINFTFEKDDICTTTAISIYKPDKIIHLASMAGVRNSIENPLLYSSVNILGFINILEESRKNNVSRVVFASSSSVYGTLQPPFFENDIIDTCTSPYACTKLSMEIFAKTYCYLYDLSIIGLRFFSVYGPRGRPDMAPFRIIKALINDTEFIKYGDGNSSRDYTYVDDIVSGIMLALNNKKNIKYGIYNLGNTSPITLNELINTSEKICNKKLKIIEMKKNIADVDNTIADITNAKKDLDYLPTVNIIEGMSRLYLSVKYI